MNRTHKRGGFTLIELLVVIAIIAILAAILFPVFARAREKARQTTCASNEKQLGLAFIQYAQDYDEYLPYGTNQINGQTNHVGMGWASTIYPYIKSSGVYTCPDDTTTTNAGNTAVSYAYNYNVISSTFNLPAGGYAVGNTYPQNKFTAPTETVLLTEWEMLGGGGVNVQTESGLGGQESAMETPGYYSQCDVGAGCNNNPAGGWGYNFIGGIVTGPMNGVTFTAGSNSGNYAQDQLTSASPWTLLPAAAGVHSGGSNFLFMDGHVKWLQGTSVVGGANAASPLTAPNGTGALTLPVVATYSLP